MSGTKRISGQDMTESQGLPYMTETEGKWRIDLCAVQSRIQSYLEEAAETGRYSISGLCIKLGITREALRLWRMGYVNTADERSARVLPNVYLAEAVAKAELFVQRYWEECEESKMQSKHTKLLQAAGLVGEGAQRASAPSYDLGRLRKYSR